MPRPWAAGTPTRRFLARFFGRAWWQGVGAVVGIAGLVIAGYAIWGGDDDAGGTHNQISAGNGNCVLQNGEGNTCQVAPASPSPVAEPLAVRATWPLAHDCDGNTRIAAMPGGPAAASVRLSPANDVRGVLIAEGGAAFEGGHLYLTLTVTDASTVQIESVRPVVFRSAATTPAWVYSSDGGCGDSYGRVFDLDLDRRSMVDRGVVGEPPASGPSAPPTASLGSSFHVSADDPAEIRIDATACHAYYEWGVVLTYLVRGVERTRAFGTAAEPYRSVGAAGTSTVPLYGNPYVRGLHTDRMVPAGTADSRLC